MGFFVAAALLVVIAGAQWFLSRPSTGDFNRAALGVFFGSRATKKVGWFKTDDRGVYVTQRMLAYVCLAVAGVCTWVGILALWID